ncbi:hypothetical protein HPB51_016102 [Rhipicephalus microplus]|uniref:Uncharacterized protein n=1 Tax=Rhipicephalus microplus TaxID=6941 RepID=A0A9J6D5M6_RHIMP|nr:hypothetical protein HPB51_016102 [Rhipicephalus microplus]
METPEQRPGCSSEGKDARVGFEGRRVGVARPRTRTPYRPSAVRTQRGNNSTVVLALLVLVLAAESFHDACHRYWNRNTNLAEDLALALSKARPPGPRHANRRCSNAPQGPEEEEEARKSKSSFSGRAPTNPGSDTSPLASARSSTRANLRELFDLLAMQREADQGKRQREDIEERTKPSVCRCRGGPPVTATLGRTPSDKRHTRLRHQHQAAAPSLRTRKCSRQSLSETSLQGGRSCVEGLVKPTAATDSTAAVVWRTRQKLTVGSKPGCRRSTFRKTGLPGSSRA